jgi:hypothetical protein
VLLQSRCGAGAKVGVGAEVVQRWCRGGTEVQAQVQRWCRGSSLQVQRFFRGLAVVLMFSSGGAQQGVGAEVQEQMCICRCAEVQMQRCRGAE